MCINHLSGCTMLDQARPSMFPSILLVYKPCWASMSEHHVSGSPLLLFVRGACMHGHDVIPQITQQSYFYGVRTPLAKYFQPAARCSISSSCLGAACTSTTTTSAASQRTKSCRSSRGEGAKTTVRERTARAETLQQQHFSQILVII